MQKQTDKAKYSIMDSFPKTTPDFMVRDWLDCLRWAIGFEPIRVEFEKETGMKFMVGRSPIERMIDDACNVHEEYIRRFVDWFNVNVWGDMQ